MSGTPFLWIPTGMSSPLEPDEVAAISRRGNPSASEPLEASEAKSAASPKQRPSQSKKPQARGKK